MSHRLVSVIIIALCLCSALMVPVFLTTPGSEAQGAVYDLVLANGRVLDPESKLDAVRHIGIRGKRITAISAQPLRGKITVDAKGLVIAPGFIDLHSHGQTEENYRFKAMDGVTTALELEVGASSVAQWYAERESKALVNFGTTVGHVPVKMAVMKDSGTFLPRDNAVTKRATPEEVRQVTELIKRGLGEGALGIGFGINYVPTSTRAEIFDLFQLAAERKVAAYVHLRHAGGVEPGSALEALQEVIANAPVCAIRPNVCK
jgi:N-acyl-D-aspartate/D-glutamate deacylase